MRKETDDIAYDIIAMYENSDADTIVAEMMKKYGHMEDVNEEDLPVLFRQYEELAEYMLQIAGQKESK